MSAEVAVRAAVLAALRGDAGLSASLNGIYDGAPVKATPPHAVVGEAVAGDWGVKGADGREVRVTITLFDRAEAPARLGEAMAAAHGAVRSMAGVADGWRIASVALIRSRAVRGGDRGWMAVSDYRVRVLADG